MKREIYEVHLAYVNADGYHISDPNVNGHQYPVVVDSKNNNNDIELTFRKSMGFLGEAEKFIANRIDDQIDYVYIIRVSDGMMLDKRMFGKLAELPNPKYVVTVTNGTGSGEYEENAVVNIDADAPDEGYVFASWEGAENLTFVAGAINSPSAAFMMPKEAVSLTATYEAIPPVSEEDN